MYPMKMIYKKYIHYSMFDLTWKVISNIITYFISLLTKYEMRHILSPLAFILCYFQSIKHDYITY